MKYIISKKYTTEARHSVDGKEHTRTTYYAGYTNLGGFLGGIENWGNRKEAVIFTNKKRAERMLKVLKEDTARIIPLSGGKKK